jgi:hypothetical protein
MPRPRHRFTLVLSGKTELSQRLQDAIYRAGCDDALLGERDGILFLDFDRAAASFRAAVLSAIADVQSANAGVDVARVEPDDLVTAAEIARRTGRSRESIRQLATGARGPGRFPAPFANLTARSPIWRWTAVRDWLSAHALGGDAAHSLATDDDRTIAALNAALELRRQTDDHRAAVSLLKTLGPPARAQRRKVI